MMLILVVIIIFIYADPELFFLIFLLLYHYHYFYFIYFLKKILKNRGDIAKKFRIISLKIINQAFAGIKFIKLIKNGLL